MADEFGRAVMRIEVDDTKLRTGLRQDEAIVNQAVGAMQADLDRLEVGVGAVGDTSIVAARGVSLLGATATATGSQVAMAGAQFANVAVIAKEFGSSTLGATAQMKAWGAGALKFMVGPAGLVVAAVAAIGTALAVTFSETARRKLTSFGLGLDELEASNARLEETLKQQNEAYALRLRALEDQIILETTGVRRAHERLRPRELELTLQLEQVKTEKQTAALRSRARQQIKDRVDLLQQETQILRGEADAVDFITNKYVRLATIERDRAAAAKQAADAKVLERQATEAMIRGIGPQTEAEALGLIVQATRQMEMAQRTQHVMATELERVAQTWGLSAGELEQLKQSLGVYLPTPTTPVQPVGGGVAVGAFPGGRAAGGAGFFESQRKEAQRTKDVGDIAKAVSIIAGAVQQGALGADRVGPP